MGQSGTRQAGTHRVRSETQDVEVCWGDQPGR